MKTSRGKSALLYFGLLIVILVIGISVGYHQVTPTKAPKDFKDDIITLQDVNGQEANFNMVMSHVYQMSKVPHPMGSPEIEEVRNYLTSQFESIGCKVEVQDFTVDMKSSIDKEIQKYNDYINDYPENKEYYEKIFAELGFSSYEEKHRADIYCTDTNLLKGTNYLVTVDAPNTNKGIMFVSHYDSTRFGPGAGDDLISVASMLEALREVNGKNQLSNDMYFLFTDGEELDLFGANAFVAKNTNMKEKIELIINLEARGNSGALLMFETSDNNKGIVEALNKAVDYTCMFSFLASLYKTMPNDTDLSTFLDAGYTGMNFAVVGSPENYHGLTDNYKNLNRNTAYMYYKTTTSLANYLSTADLTSLKSKEDAVYFPFIKGNTIILSNHVMLIISGIVSMLSLLWVILLFTKKKTRIKDFIKVFLLMIATLAISALIGYGGAYVYDKVWRSDEVINIVWKLHLIFYLICFIVVTITVLMIYIMEKLSKQKQTPIACVMILFNLLNCVSMYLLNGVAYLFTITLLFVFVYSVIMYLKNDSKIMKNILFVYVLVAGLIVLLLFTPVIYLIYIGLLSSGLYANSLLVCIAVIPIAVIGASIVFRKHVLIR
jgi:hypothetical protein